MRQRQRIVLDLIKRQLASTSVGEVWGGDQQLASLKGDAKSVEFVSHIPLTPGNRFGTVYVRYVVKQAKGGEGEQPTFYERNVALLDKRQVRATRTKAIFRNCFPG